MTTKTTKAPENTQNKTENANENHEKGKQGFASMPKEQVREIAAEGGRHSHDHTNAKKDEK